MGGVTLCYRAAVYELGYGMNPRLYIDNDPL